MIINIPRTQGPGNNGFYGIEHLTMMKLNNQAAL